MLHPDRLLDCLTGEELSEWEAYNKIEPIGQYRTDMMIAQLISLFHNFASSFGSKNGKRQVAHPIDFIPWLEKAEALGAPKEQSLEEMKAAMHAIAGAFNKKKGTEDPSLTRPPKRLRERMKKKRMKGWT